MSKTDERAASSTGSPHMHVPAGAVRLLPVAISARGERMLLHFSAIADVMMRMHGIPAALKEATKSRLKYFQNRNFPLPTSRQGKARIGIDDALKIAFAFELLETGMGPLRALRLTATDWPIIREAVAAAWWRAQGGGGPAFDIAIAPRALREMNLKDELLGSPLVETLGALRRGGVPFQRCGRTLLLIDVEAMATGFGQAVTSPKLAKSGDFDRAMAEYCADTFSAEDRTRWRPRLAKEASETPSDAAAAADAT